MVIQLQRKAMIRLTAPPVVRGTELDYAVGGNG